jgi:hypothetical protein
MSFYFLVGNLMGIKSFQNNLVMATKFFFFFVSTWKLGGHQVILTMNCEGPPSGH